MPSDTFVIRFFVPVTSETCAGLLQLVDLAIGRKKKRLVLLLSTPGGDVLAGLTAHNFLRGAPIEVTTHNIGSCDSIGIVLFCAGTRRLSVPHARFLLHGVAAQFAGSGSLEEKQLEERLKQLQIDAGNIARVVSDATGRALDRVVGDMHERTTLYPEQARDYGLVHEIKVELFESGTDFASVHASSPSAPGAPQPGGPPQQGVPIEFVLPPGFPAQLLPQGPKGPPGSGE